MKLFIAVTLEVFLIAFNVISQTQTFMLGMAGNYPEGYSYSGSSGVNWSLYNELSLNIWQGFGIGDRQAE